MTGLDDPLVVTPTVRIPAFELDWRFSGSGGPGGQHANTANTRVELLFDVTASEAFSPSQRQRVLARLGPVVRVVSATERSQLANRREARRRLAERLVAALAVRPDRRATGPTAAARRRRMEDKARRGLRKRERSLRHQVDE